MAEQRSAVLGPVSWSLINKCRLSFFCCKMFMNFENFRQEIMEYLIATISSKSVLDCEYRG
jgi:hypothetical protein